MIETSEFKEIIDNQAVASANFLHGFSRMAGKPLFLGCRSNLPPKMETGGPDDLMEPDLIGVVIVVPCDAETAQRLAEVFEAVISGADIVEYRKAEEAFEPPQKYEAERAIDLGKPVHIHWKAIQIFDGDFDEQGWNAYLESTPEQQLQAADDWLIYACHELHFTNESVAEQIGEVEDLEILCDQLGREIHRLKMKLGQVPIPEQLPLEVQADA